MLNLMPEQYRMLALGLALAAAFVAGGSAAWNVRGWKADADIAEVREGHQQEITRFEETADQIRKSAEEAKAAAEARLQAIASTHEIQLRNVRHEADRLARDLAARPVRVRVANCEARPGGSGVPGTTSNPGSVVGEATAELDRAFVADLAGIARDGDEGIVQLNALIEACSVR